MATPLPTRTPPSVDRERVPARPAGARGGARGPGGDAPRGDARFGGGERSGGGERGGFRPQHNPDRRRMLDVRREGHLKYDLRELLGRTTLAPEATQTFIATVLSKGARQSTHDAKDWVSLKMTEGAITKPDRDAINQLLDRYSKWR